MQPLHRIPQLDFLRGVMLIIMMMDHLIYFPLWSLRGVTYDITFQTFGFVSGAEGFIFVSGMLFGLVYGRKYLESGAAVYTRLAARRMGNIYVHYLGAYLAVALLFAWPVYVAAWPGIWPSHDALIEDPWGMFARGAVFVHQTSLLDILPMYIIFIGLAIPAMRLLAAGRWKLLFAVSVLLWFVGQARPQLYIEMQTGLELGWFELAAWQLVFISGVALGYWWAAHPNFRPPVSGKYIAAALAVCVPLFIYRHQFALLENADEIWFPELFDVRNLGAARILNTAALAYLVYALSAFRPRWFHVQFVEKIGGAALLVFCYHIVACYALAPFRDEFAAMPVAVQLIIWAALVASIYLPAMLFHAIKNRVAKT